MSPPKKVPKMGQPKKSRKQRICRRKWDFNEEVAILRYIREAKEQGYNFESPTATIYYNRLIKKLGIRNCDLSQMKNKTKNLKTSFSEAVTWQGQTGQGVDDGSVQAHLRKMCPHYDILLECFGDKASFVLPYMCDSLEVDHENNTVNQNIGNGDASQRNNDECEEVFGFEGDLLFVRDDGDEEFTTDAVFMEVNDSTVISQTTTSSTIQAHQPNSVSQTSLLNINRPPLNCNTSNRQPNNAHPSSSRDDPTQLTIDLPPLSSNPTSRANNSQRILVTNRQSNRDNPVSQPSQSSFLSQNDDDFEEPPREIPRETISRFKEQLSSRPQSSNGFKPRINVEASNAAAVIGKALTRRADTVKEKAENEAIWKMEEIKLAREKLEFEKEMRREEMKLKQSEMEINEKIRILALEKDERLAELRIRLELGRGNENAR